MSFSQRLSLALSAGLDLPASNDDVQRGVVFGVTPETDVSALPGDVSEWVVVSRDARVHARFGGSGAQLAETPPETAATAIVLLSREKARARDDMAQAAACCEGHLLVDGQKTDGVEPMLKALKARGGVSAPISKAHGKLFWCAEAPDLTDWRASPLSVDGLRSWPGVFSAEKVDAGSRLLASVLSEVRPPQSGGALCDLGAGWGWLSAQIADGWSAAGAEIHIIETDGWALDCARHNLPQAVAHWADVTTWQAPRRFDMVVMNPPFHQGRKGVPDLGQAFITKAAEVLAPTGQLYMVANRHLPYEATLESCFGAYEEIGGDGRFKLFRASRPKPTANRARTAARTVTRTRR